MFFITSVQRPSRANAVSNFFVADASILFYGAFGSTQTHWGANPLGSFQCLYPLTVFDEGEGKRQDSGRSRPLRHQPPCRNFMSRATPPPKFLWLSQIPAKNVNFISQRNIFRHNFGAHRNPVNYYISDNVESVNAAH